MTLHHQTLTKERWFALSLAEQLANVGSEVSRMTRWRTKDGEIAERAFERMLELVDLTLSAHSKESRLREVARIRELLVTDWYSEEGAGRSGESWNRYFLQFALLARKNPSSS